MRSLLGALALTLALTAAQPLTATRAAAADVKTFQVRGGAGTTAYAGTVRVTTVPAAQDDVIFMNVDWTFGGFVVKGYGIVAKDDPTLLTVSYVVPVGLGVARYKIQPDGSVIGTLVGEKGFFVQEVWTQSGGRN